MLREWNDKILNVNGDGFEALALEIYRFQNSGNPVYSEYIKALNISARGVDSISKIPFLPIKFFGSHEVKTTAFEPAIFFESSGTTGASTSRHYIRDIGLYEQSFMKCFESFYGPVRNYCILGLLPSYLERNNSSLVYMVDKLIMRSSHPQSGFYLKDFKKLINVLHDLKRTGQPVLLFGVTFALLDLAAEIGHLNLKDLVIMETGGMKGRRQEMVRQEVHQVLKNAFGVGAIHSEYGMTELLSQAYSRSDGLFEGPPWTKIVLRDEDDPLNTLGTGNQGNEAVQAGPINIIDLANVYSCSFIATDDVGKLYPDGRFEVVGRIDRSDLRGCSLLVV